MLNWLRSQIQAIASLLRGVSPLLTSLWHKVLDFKTKTLNIFGTIQHLVDSVRQEFEAIQHFQERPQWKNRVISVPRALDAITALPDIAKDFVDKIRDLIQQLREKIEPAEVNLEDVEALERVPTKLLRGAEKLIGWATLILDALTTIETALDDLQAIVDDVRQFRETIENLDGLFLPQNNPRQWTTIHERARVRDSSGLKRLRLGSESVNENITKGKGRAGRSRTPSAPSPKRQAKKSQPKQSAQSDPVGRPKAR